MLARKLLASSLLSTAVSIGIVGSIPLLFPCAARAQDINPDEGNTKNHFEGLINSNSVYVHSGPSENDYPTMRLDRGTHVTIVGIRNSDWLKIVPPDGSFCYVAKAYTEKRGDGTVGRTTNALNVHIGSDLNTLKVKLGRRLEAGTDVEIIGEQDEYFKIKPPEGVYLYVSAQFVTPVRQIPLAPAPDSPVVQANDSSAGGATPPPQISATPSEGGLAEVDGPTTAPDASAEVPTTGPSVASAVPSTQPQDGAAAAQAEFDKLESTFATESGKPLEDQNPRPLSESYDKLAKGGMLPDSLRKVAEYKAAALKARADDRDEYLAVKKEQDEMKARVAALRAEREELEVRVKQSEIKAYAAVGTLRASSLQVGSQTLYRLTDPASGRTVIYLRTNDPALGTLMNQFIGVKGAVSDDAQLNLRVIDATSFETVDQSKLYTGVMSEIVPPSLLPQGQANVSN